MRKEIPIRPLAYGGGQERNLRPSTENVPGIVGLGEAIHLGMREMNASVSAMLKLREHIIDATMDAVPGTYLNGARQRRLCNNANFRFDGVEGEAVVLDLDFHGIAASTGSACSARSTETSHVMRAIGLTPDQARGALRVSLSKFTTMEEADRFIKAIEATVKRLRSLAPPVPGQVARRDEAWATTRR